MKELIRLIGSPFVSEMRPGYSDEELLALHDPAFDDRVALLYLSLYRRPGWSPELERRYQALAERREMTLSVVAEAARTLNHFDPGSYVIFKSLKPYPATPNDTDILFLGSNAEYERAYEHLLNHGYIFHEWAPQQRTVYDRRGVGRIGKGKKGGTYYIDFYTEVSTDYFAYLNKNRVRPFIFRESIEGVDVPRLRPEPELAIILYHNVFPERTFQLEHFYLPLYYFAAPRFDLNLFMRFAEENHMNAAVRANLSLVAQLHRSEFGTVPAPVRRVLARWGSDRGEQARFSRAGMRTPYLFSPRLFWQSFACKLAEWYSLRTALVQAWELHDPHFLREVFGSMRKRLGSESIYQLE